MLDHFEIGEIKVFVDISVSLFNFDMTSKYIAIRAASDVTLTPCANTVYIREAKIKVVGDRRMLVLGELNQTTIEGKKKIH